MTSVVKCPGTSAELAEKWAEYDINNGNIYVPDGWVNIVDRCLEACLEAHQEMSEPFAIAQVKTKFGHLRIYLEYTDYAVESRLNIMCEKLIKLTERLCSDATPQRRTCL